MYRTVVPGSPCEKIVSFFANSATFRDTPAESRKACASKASFLLVSRDGLVLLGVALGIPFRRTLMSKASPGISYKALSIKIISLSQMGYKRYRVLRAGRLSRYDVSLPLCLWAYHRRER